MTCRIRLVLALLFVFGVSGAFAQPAPAGSAAPKPYQGSGYEVELPAGWELASSSDQYAIRGEVQRMFPNLNQMDLSALDMFAFDLNSSQNFATNYNIAVIPDSLEITEKNRRDYIAGLTQELQQSGIVINSMNSYIQTVGSAKCITAEFESKILGMNLYQRMHLFFDETQGYILTFTTPISEKQKYQATFDQVLTSFGSTNGTLKADPKPFAILMPLLIAAGLFAAVIVVVVIVVIKLTRK